MRNGSSFELISSNSFPSCSWIACNVVVFDHDSLAPNHSSGGVNSESQVYGEAISKWPPRLSTRRKMASNALDDCTRSIQFPASTRSHEPRSEHSCNTQPTS